jgi:hypothetical protein
MTHLADAIAALHQAAKQAPACTGRCCPRAESCAHYAAWMAGQRHNVAAPCVLAEVDRFQPRKDAK